VLDADHDGVGERVVTLAKGLREPNGVAFRDGALYVGEISRILRYDAIESHSMPCPRAGRGDRQTAARRHHGWKGDPFRAQTASSTFRWARHATSACAGADLRRHAPE
jgi:hypothetical protein